MESIFKIIAAFSVICGLAYALYRIYDRKFIHDQLKSETDNLIEEHKKSNKIEFYGCNNDSSDEEYHVFGDADCDVDFSDVDEFSKTKSLSEETETIINNESNIENKE